MPASYAHYRFGKLLLPKLPADVRQCIQRFRRMYDVGLQGPDFFFYYNPFFKTTVGALGARFHRQSGQEFFTRVCAQASSEAAQAYLYGLLGHYCLDSQCHPYVSQMVTIGEASHVALESEFDRHLLVGDGRLPPQTQNISGKLKLTRGECMTVSAFYPPATGAQISRSLRMMAFDLKFLSNPHREKTEGLLKKLSPSLTEHMVPCEENPEYILMVKDLQEHYDEALLRYPLLLRQLQEHRNTGAPLGGDFAPDFG